VHRSDWDFPIWEFLGKLPTRYHPVLPVLDFHPVLSTPDEIRYRIDPVRPVTGSAGFIRYFLAPDESGTGFHLVLLPPDFRYRIFTNPVPDTGFTGSKSGKSGIR
jgi:hypothetical protein